jgi:ABC-type glycerol-3-phosphate transport system substrate-binding protein
MHLRALVFATLIATAGLAACASTTYEVRSSVGVGVEFKYRTFSFGADPAKLPKDFKATTVTPEVKKKTEETLNLELGKRGYAVDDANPDLQVLVASGQRPDKFRSGTAGQTYDSQVLSDGTLVVEVWDTKMGDIIWRGIIEAHIDRTQNFDYAALVAAVTTLMQPFPKAASQEPAAPPPPH